jgi:hypothetical protein
MERVGKIFISMKEKGKDPPFFETFFLKTILDIYFCPFSKNKIEC